MADIDNIIAVLDNRMDINYYSYFFNLNKHLKCILTKTVQNINITYIRGGFRLSWLVTGFLSMGND